MGRIFVFDFFFEIKTHQNIYYFTKMVFNGQKFSLSSWRFILEEHETKNAEQLIIQFFQVKIWLEKNNDSQNVSNGTKVLQVEFFRALW